MANNDSKIRKTAIIGMGALGLLYGNHIVKHCGQDAVTYVMDRNRLKKYQNESFSINGEPVHFHMTAAEDMKPVDLLIVAVKYTGLKAALDIMKNCINEQTVIISVLNGISSEEIIGERYGMEGIVYTVAQGMDAMKFGNALNYTKMGELHIGLTKEGNREKLERLISWFDEIGMPYMEESDIFYRMWSKFMLNVGVNQTCMVYGTTYAGALAKGEPNRTMIAAMREVIALANAEGIPLSEKDINQYMDILKTLSPKGMPSMAQDRVNKKASEVEMFGGTVLKLAKKHGIYAPANEFLYEKVREIESAYAIL
ncbi:MAG: ketopantoate reductase family protein [Lachnospiraceae bacterium]|nr:ketopantoate reductase family protein [Lachnospiraceae bacterium]